MRVCGWKPSRFRGESRHIAYIALFQNEDERDYMDLHRGVQILLGIFVNWILLIIGGLNLFSAIGDIKYSGGVLKNPAGIIKKFEPLAGPIVVLVYNLIFGGAIGVIGSIYYLVGIRSFVLSNREASASYDPVVPNVGIGARIMSICLDLG